MTEGRDIDTLLTWADQGQRRVEGAVRELAPHAVAEPSALPEWTRGHVLTHLARNADALINLLTWARTGVETPMYSSRQQRDADIDAGASRSPYEQLEDLRESGRRFADAAATLAPDQWNNMVVNGQGQRMPAHEIPWMRVREVWIHLVDLDVGAGIDEMPDQVAWELVRDVAMWMTPRLEQRVDLRVMGFDLLRMGPAEAAPRAEISGTGQDIAGWLVGRTGVDGLTATGDIPELPRWL